MAKHVKGSAVPNATSYKLFNYSTGAELATQNSGGAIGFDLSALNLTAGTYTLAVKAYDSTGTYATSEYSNTVSYTYVAPIVYYTITYKYMSGSTEIKTATTEQVAAGTTKNFSIASASSISGYTCSSVSPSGQQTINSNITVTYNYTANAVNPPASGDTGTIRWTNHGYQATGGLTANSKRAMARMAAIKGDIIRIEGLEGFTMVDLVAFDADGETTFGYTAATPAAISLTYENGVVTFQVPGFGVFANCSYVGLVIKYASEVAIDVSTLPASYTKVLLPVTN
jgi:hypothetical protein